MSYSSLDCDKELPNGGGVLYSALTCRSRNTVVRNTPSSKKIFLTGGGSRGSAVPIPTPPPPQLRTSDVPASSHYIVPSNGFSGSISNGGIRNLSNNLSRPTTVFADTKFLPAVVHVPQVVKVNSYGSSWPKEEQMDHDVLYYPQVYENGHPNEVSQYNYYNALHQQASYHDLKSSGSGGSSLCDSSSHYSSDFSDSSSPPPLDLSVKKAPPQNLRPSPKLEKLSGLMVLAEAVNHVIKTDKESSDAFYGHRSSPSGSLESHSSTGSLESQSSNLSYDSDTPLDGYEESSITFFPGDFESNEIVLNSNYERVDRKPCQLESLVYSSDEVLHCGSTAFCTDRMAEVKLENSEEESYMTTSVGGKRVRLSKNEYGMMSETEKKIRHRKLDNNRSKTYRCRRKLVQLNLRREIGDLESRQTDLQNHITRLTLKNQILSQALLMLDKLRVKDNY